MYPRITCNTGPLVGYDDLNLLPIADDHGVLNQKDHRAVSRDGQTRVLFKKLDEELIDMIAGYNSAVGCVAWLTHFDILDALAKMQAVSLIVQKEDFLRPDVDEVHTLDEFLRKHTRVKSSWKEMLRNKYAALRDGCRYEYQNCIVSGLSSLSDSTLGAIRCVGNHNANKRPAFPRSHHKFIVFGDLVECAIDDEIIPRHRFEPRAAWSGSFNFTQNAVRSFENALVTFDRNLVNAFYQEWAQIAALSEPLDWTSEWAHPEFRIGT